MRDGFLFAVLGLAPLGANRQTGRCRVGICRAGFLARMRDGTQHSRLASACSVPRSFAPESRRRRRVFDKAASALRDSPAPCYHIESKFENEERQKMKFENEFVQMLFDDLNDRTGKSIATYVAELSNLRAGRANVRILDSVRIDCYGSSLPLNQVANISVPEARMIVISVWDASLLKTVEKALIDANLGITPTNDGRNIRLVFPEPTEERRMALVKNVKSGAEGCKIAVRNIRRDIISELKKLEKNKEIGEDLELDYEDEVNRIVTEKTAEIDKISADKEREILTI